MKYQNQNDDDDIEEEQDKSSPAKVEAAEPRVFSESVKALNSDRGHKEKGAASTRQNKINVFRYNAPAQNAYNTAMASSQQFGRGFAEPAEAWNKSENSNLQQKSLANP